MQGLFYLSEYSLLLPSHKQVKSGQSNSTSINRYDVLFTRNDKSQQVDRYN